MVQVVIDGADDTEIMWLSTLSVALDGTGCGTATHPGIEVARETVLWVTAIGPEGQVERIETVALSIVGSVDPVGRDDIVARHVEITSERESRYRQPMGLQAEGLARHRVVYIVENLLVTRTLHFQHGSVHALDLTLHESDLRAAVNHALEMLGWPSRVDDEGWETSMRRNDFAVIEFPEVWASDWADAERSSLADAERYMSAIAFLRHAAPRLVMIVIEREGPPISSKMRAFRMPYRGNLVGGPIAGENQVDFLATAEALNTDPKAALYVSLYLDAQRDGNPDSRYFKLWSVLETIAINRIEPGQAVQLPDGTPWPDGATTAQAAPRVFEFVRQSTPPQRDWPDGGLYPFIRAAYGRRTATAHYGRFLPDNPDQLAKPWYEWAVRTITDRPGSPDFLWELEHLVHDVVATEIRRVSPL
ncbi:hypothetical protein LQ757_04610 [Agromyces sp. SYSU K20354]|uniref:hypothetical protein n=1 Tax=Agromyces cavernae TaxID=2898659 RepID=UPI001E5BAEB6|nr:hypothetical protein [Agromyces cavernae]MCD2441556.1 hypothetical protein [Agromyces cavernae]